MQVLQARLAELAASGQTITYGALARDLGLSGGSVIAQLTGALETLMEQDAAAGQPLRAALCAGRLAQGIPSRGFFDKAVALGCLADQDPLEFVREQRARLFRNNLVFVRVRTSPRAVMPICRSLILC